MFGTSLEKGPHQERPCSLDAVGVIAVVRKHSSRRRSVASRKANFEAGCKSEKMGVASPFAGPPNRGEAVSCTRVLRFYNY
jgi:hypothetical protein